MANFLVYLSIRTKESLVSSNLEYVAKQKSALPLLVILALVALCGFKWNDMPFRQIASNAQQVAEQPPTKSKKDPPKKDTEPNKQAVMPNTPEASKGVPLAPPPANACIDNWCREQLGYAAIIVDVGRRTTNLPKRAWVIAVATAMQESGLRNQATQVYPITLTLPHEKVGSDHDSVGLFQQRPASGWGSPEELMNPRTAAEKFYSSLKKALKQRPDWQSARLTDIAQAVQKSAYPDHYQKHEPTAIKIIDYVLRHPYKSKMGTANNGSFAMMGCKNPKSPNCMMVRWQHIQPVIDNRQAFRQLFPRATYAGDLGDEHHMNAETLEDHTPSGHGCRPNHDKCRGWVYAQDFGGGGGFDLVDFTVWLLDCVRAGKYPEIKYIISTHPGLAGKKDASGNTYRGIFERFNGWAGNIRDDHNKHVHISYMPGATHANSTIIADYYRHKNGR